MVKKSTKGLVAALALAAVTGTAQAGVLRDSSGAAVTDSTGAAVTTRYGNPQDSQKATSFDCNGTTIYNTVKDNGGNGVELVLGEIGDILTAPVRFPARVLGAITSYGDKTVMVNGHECPRDAVYGSKVMMQDGINAVLGAAAYKNMLDTGSNSTTSTTTSSSGAGGSAGNSGGGGSI